MLQLVSSLFVSALMTAAAPPVASTTQLPPHGAFISLCIKAISPQDDTATIQAIAACQCHFDTMPANGVVNEVQFNEGVETCKAEGYQKTLEFTKKYVKRFELKQEDLAKQNKLTGDNLVQLPAR